MSRWFIAVFALHFLVGVLLSTLGMAQPRALEADGQAAALQVSASASKASDTLSLLDDFDHALMDDQQDLPDVLHETLDVARVTAPGGSQVQSPVPDRLSRALAPPDKPPRPSVA